MVVLKLRVPENLECEMRAGDSGRIAKIHVDYLTPTAPHYVDVNPLATKTNYSAPKPSSRTNP
jgi:hypothetical protein